MLTSRGWWFLMGVLALLAFVALANETTLTLLALTLLLWFCWEWLGFTMRVTLGVRRLRVERQLHDDRGPVEALWAGRSFRVQVRLRIEGLIGLSYVRITDRVPFGVEHMAGATESDGDVGADRPLALEYSVRCPHPGRVRFEGLRVELADLQGFFYHRTFVPGVLLYRVLPPLADVEGHSPTVKRHNILPSPGQHRFRRPGSGSELLDLRDYMPGDPPKTIAWKVSARRDRLITKEFESEVPVRCTLFVDASHSVRVGPQGQNALARLAELAAAVTQANSGTRDLTGLCLFDEAGVSSYLRPARGARHVVRVLNLLADAAGQAPATGQARVAELLPLAHAFAEEVYPYLLRPEVNQVPFWLPWLWAQSAVGPRRGPLPRWFPALFAPQRRRLARWRKRLAALLAVRHGLGPGGLALLLEDDEQLALHLQRFLAEHQVPYPVPLYDRRGRYLFASPGKVDVLARTLVRAVGRGHDNELFVLLVDLLELPEQLGPVVRAVKVALARHHQVLVISPWPPGVPPPESQRPGQRTADSAPDGAGSPRGNDLEEAMTARFHVAFARLRRQLGRLGVPVVCARSGDPAQVILDRLDRLRSLRRRR